MNYFIIGFLTTSESSTLADREHVANDLAPLGKNSYYEGKRYVPIYYLQISVELLLICFPLPLYLPLVFGVCVLILLNGLTDCLISGTNAFVRHYFLPYSD